MIIIHDRISISVDEAVTLATTAVHRHEDGEDARSARLLREAIEHLENAERALLKSAGRTR